jgi:hypothetical protein
MGRTDRRPPRRGAAVSECRPNQVGIIGSIEAMETAHEFILDHLELLSHHQPESAIPPPRPT